MDPLHLSNGDAISILERRYKAIQDELGALNCLSKEGRAVVGPMLEGEAAALDKAIQALKVARSWTPSQSPGTEVAEADNRAELLDGVLGKLEEGAEMMRTDDLLDKIYGHTLRDLVRGLQQEERTQHRIAAGEERT